MWHYFSGLYGKRIKFLVFKKTRKKIAFGKPFFSLIAFLELRLNILLIRIRFVSKVLEANTLLVNRSVVVNGFFKQKSYLAKVNDIIAFNKLVFKVIGGVDKKGKKLRFVTKKWRKFLWKRWRKKNKFNKVNKSVIKRISIFRFSKKIVLSLNYLEVSYKILTCIVLKKPVLGEVLIGSSKKILSSTMLKKIYFLY